MGLFTRTAQFNRPAETFRTTTSIPTSSPKPTHTPSQTPSVLPSSYIQELSFAAQAPFGEWSDPVQQDGCEEASSLTAVYWAMGKKFTKSEALQVIKDLSAYQINTYGQARDTSAHDTWQRLIVGYFSHSKSEVKDITRVEEIIYWLAEGKLVIVPADGQTLNNPFFTPPGPDRHMIVIRGYDSQKKEFITNDVGTRQGENFRYSSTLLFSALRDYPTGDHLPIEKTSRKAILIWK